MVVFTAEVHKDRSLLGAGWHGLGACGELFLDVCFLEGCEVRWLGNLV